MTSLNYAFREGGWKSDVDARTYVGFFGYYSISIGGL